MRSKMMIGAWTMLALAACGSDVREERVGLETQPASSNEPGAKAPGAPRMIGAAGGPTWNMATLIIPSTDVVVTDKGVTKRVTVQMTNDEIARSRAAANETAGLVGSWSGALGEATMTVLEAAEPLRKVSSAGDGPNDGFWASPSDVGDILTHASGGRKFDSVFVVWNPGNATSSVPSCCYWGQGPAAEVGRATYAALHPSANGEAFIHEWLHGSTYFYREAGFDVPDPHDNSLFGHPTTDADGSWKSWYGDLMTARISRNGKPVGFTASVWASGTPQQSSKTGNAPPPRDEPHLPPVTNPAPGKATPKIRAASVQGDWVYLEWEIVPAVGEYQLFFIAKKTDGSRGESFSQITPGASDRGAFRYTYAHKNDLCPAVARTAGAAYPARFAVQVWPAGDSSAAENAEADGTIACP